MVLLFFKINPIFEKIFVIFLTDGRKLADPRNCRLVTSYKPAFQPGKAGVGGVVRSMMCGIIEEESVITRCVCHSVEDNPDAAPVIAFHWDGRFGKWDRHAVCEFQGCLFGHTRDPVEARRG